MLDSLDDDSFLPTRFDLVRLEGLEVDGEGVQAESGLWTVFRYRDGYTLFMNKGKYLAKEFQVLDNLVDFLKTLEKNRKR